MSTTTEKSHTVRVTAGTHDQLRELSQARGEPITLILARAVERYRRQCILEEANAQYAALLADPEERAAIQAEQRELDGTLLDGLEDDPW
jgi:hypothetical protein